MGLLLEVERRWMQLWRRLALAGKPIQVFRELIPRYSEPHRHYHNLRHISHCLYELAPVRNLAAQPDAIEMAIWFHDAIYDSRATDNEDQSARLAQNVLQKALAPDPFVQRVGNLILATRHQTVAEDHDAKLLQDIDLAILGQDVKSFDKYEAAIRKEYEWVPWPIFAEKRSAILKTFLDRPAIYVTRPFHDEYESPARTNLARAIRSLNSPA